MPKYVNYIQEYLLKLFNENSVNKKVHSLPCEIINNHFYGMMRIDIKSKFHFYKLDSITIVNELYVRQYVL